MCLFQKFSKIQYSVIDARTPQRAYNNVYCSFKEDDDNICHNQNELRHLELVCSQKTKSCLVCPLTCFETVSAF